ncbi:MAG: DEAD/DEAH box helicase [Gemmatimonadetes bacterium]|nr:DEAD/DEAH box helicase [Gemmatimonadota bacterium]
MSSRPTTPANRPPAAGFTSLDLDPRVFATLAELGYEEPTPIQSAAIPPLLAGRDVLAQAATGTGKTAAFALPLLHRITPDAPPRQRTTALVLVPTRELAMQVAEAFYRYGKAMGAVSVPIYGGASMETQIRSLKRGADVVIATPGRALDHIRRKTIHLASIRTVVLDEADEMLDMGFAEDLEAILAETPADKQVALFSATLAPRISAIARTHQRDPEVIRIDAEAVKSGVTAKVRQVAYVVARAHKMVALGRILDAEQPKSAIVFCRTRTEVDSLTETLNARGYHAEALHGGLSQIQRDRVMKKFRAHTSDLLIATDVAARGLDVQHVSHVVNYDVPAAGDAYVHRIGRTGRAGRSGTAITLAEPRERRMLSNIERVTGRPIEILTVPTVSDLKARRLEVAQAALREVIVEGGLDPWRGVVSALAGEFDLADIAAAAVKQAALKDGAAEDEQEIPTAAPARERHPARDREADRAARREVAGGRPGAKEISKAHAKSTPKTAGKREYPELGGPVAKLYVGGGRKVKIRAGDLVGAITNETGMAGTSIGAIRIWDRHSIVEVPEPMVDEIIAALAATTIKGKKLLVRRDRSGH